VAAKPFVVTTSDTLYSGLKTKLPYLVCNGILHPTSLRVKQFTSADGTTMDFSDLTIKTGQPDSITIKKYKDIFHQNQVRFFIEGEISISNDQFYLSIYPHDLFENLKPFVSEPQPLSQFQRVIDDACENLNFQFKSRSLGKKTKTILIEHFDISISKNEYDNYWANHYDTDFPARYLAGTLITPRDYVILPYTSEPASNSAIKSQRLQHNDTQSVIPDMVISGKVKFEDGKCAINLYLRAGNDSISLQPLKDNMENKDNLLASSLNNVQSVLNSVISVGGIEAFRKVNADYSESEYEAAFEKAWNLKNFPLAYYYADQIGLRFSSKSNKSLLLKAKLSYRDGAYGSAISQLETYQKEMTASNTTDAASSYYMALCLMGQGRYDQAKTFLDKVDSISLSFKDIYYVKGVCMFNLESYRSALSSFERQIKVNDTAVQDVYAFAGFCYQALNMPAEAERSFKKLFDSDSLNVTYRKYLSDFYSEHGKKKLDAREFDGASQYLLKSYKISPAYKNLMAIIEMTLELRKPNETFYQLIQTGIRDSVFSERSIYLQLADFCRSKVDPVTSLYIEYYLLKSIDLVKTHNRITGIPAYYKSLGSSFFRLNLFDSAEFYYKKNLTLNKGAMDYFNLAELQVMQLKTTEALATLKNVYSNIIEPTKYSNKNQRDYHLALYYFYATQALVLQGNFNPREKADLLRTIKPYSQVDGKLFTTWNFNTFYNWIKANKDLNQVVQQKLLENLCPVIKYSKSQFQCEI
jgi:tetratricopeptide (TPR) repeat protein